MILVLYLTISGLQSTTIGSLFTVVLTGDALVTLLITTRADYYGRKRMLCISSLLSFCTGLILVVDPHFWPMLVAGFFGLLSPSG